MTQQDKAKLLDFLQQFCQENQGNRMNTWLAEAMLNRTGRLIDSLVEQSPQGQVIDRGDLQIIPVKEG